MLNAGGKIKMVKCSSDRGEEWIACSRDVGVDPLVEAACSVKLRCCIHIMLHDMCLIAAGDKLMIERQGHERSFRSASQIDDSFQAVPC